MNRPKPPITDIGLPLDTEYADDIDFNDIDDENLKAVLPIATEVLKNWNLFINEDENDFTHVYSAEKGVKDNQGKPSAGGFHEPTPFSENPYLAMVVENMKIHFPKLQFNSAMVTKYENGKQGIPPHSDNEECISSGSYICTVSLGETRTLEYRSISEASQISSRIQLVHGDILFMTRESQNLYQHSVPMDYTKNMRISITLRQITCSSTNSSTNPSINLTSFNCAETEFQDSRSQTIGFTTVKGVSTIRVDNQHLHSVLRPSKSSHTLPTIKKSVSTQACSSRDQQSINTDPRTNCDKNGTEGKEPRSTSLYISSSMFRKLDYKKLSSKSQDAHVFSYPGATAQIIKERFMNDEKEKSLDPSQVKNIMLMCGSNNIDSILRSPKEMRNQVLLHGKPKSHASLTDNTNLAIEDLVLFLHNWAPSATVKIINILPRQSRCRNEDISDINRFIIQLSNKYSYVKFVSTERERFLFTDRNVHAFWVPHFLSESNKTAWVACCRPLLELFNTKGLQYMGSNYVIEDEPWFLWSQKYKGRVWIGKKGPKPADGPEDVKAAIQRSIRVMSENTLMDQLKKLCDH
ncbi:hypothetical protein ACHWQZ_G014395 [Mnemiopsis leidyi]